MSRIPYLNKQLPPLASPTRAGPLEEPAPAVKQLLGVTVQEKQNAAEDELARLGIQRREVLPSSGDPRYDRAMATLMGPVVEKVIGRIVTGPKYQAMDNPTKAEVLSKALGYIRDAATKAIPNIDAAMALQQQYARMGVRDRIFLENLWSKLPPDRRTKLQNLLIR